MPPQQQEKRPTDEEKQERRALHSLLGKHVIHALGQPGDLLRVQVQQVWEDHYRVNVFVGVDAASVKVAHSYFLVTDGEGNILASTPEITKRY
jgi:hypothetical protein